jgi:hypothetical protein
MKQTYKGSCHCGKVQFEVDADFDHVRVCDCSICRRRGALIHRVEEKCFRLLTPIEELSLYQWHTKTAKDRLFLPYLRNLVFPSSAYSSRSVGYQCPLSRRRRSIIHSHQVRVWKPAGLRVRLPRGSRACCLRPAPCPSQLKAILGCEA